MPRNYEWEGLRVQIKAQAGKSGRFQIPRLICVQAAARGSNFKQRLLKKPAHSQCRAFVQGKQPIENSRVQISNFLRNSTTVKMSQQGFHLIVRP